MNGLKVIIRSSMFEETKIILNILKKYFLFIIVLPFLPSIIILFYSSNYESEFIELYRYNIYTETINRDLYSNIDSIIYKIDNTIEAYDKDYIKNLRAIKILRESEKIILGDMFRQFMINISSSNEVMENIYIDNLNINTLTTIDFYNRSSYEKNDLNKLQIDFYTYTSDINLIKKVFEAAIENINILYAKAIYKNNERVLLSLISDIKLLIETNKIIINTLSKQLNFISDKRQTDYTYEKQTETELKILFLKDYESSLLDIINEIDTILLNKNYGELKMINNIWDIKNIYKTKSNYLIKYLYIISYFLFLILFLFLSIIYEYNFKRKT